MSVDIRLARDVYSSEEAGYRPPRHLVAPGDIISTDPGFLSGHGTYVKDEGLVASVAGVVDRVNKHVKVKPLKARYNGEVGDVVIGRIIEVQQKSWKVDVNSRLDAVLPLSSVNLPGGELRRKTEEDERSMRGYLQEGDLISAEVQKINQEGQLQLHTRSLRYGKLCQGTMVSISPSLVARRKTHFHSLPCGATVVLGNNGYIWVAPTMGLDREGGGFMENFEEVCAEDREAVARLRNCVSALAKHRVLLHDTSLEMAYEDSARYEIKDLLCPDVMKEIADTVRLRLDPDSM